MSKIEAKVVTDSKNEFGNRIATMVVTFPRIILAEFNTHRMFSRNSASSRAIPFAKMLKSIKTNPFIPIAWQKDHKGMQGTEYFNDIEAQILKNKWLKARDRAIESALDLAAGILLPDTVFEFDNNDELIVLQDYIGLTKQLVNRLLEPFMYHTVIVTATEWENFFALRCPKYDITSTTPDEFSEVYRSRKDVIKVGFRAFKGKNVERMTDLDWLLANSGQAEIHMMALAEAMWDALNESTPKQLKAGEWHIPYHEVIVNMIKKDGTNFFPYPADLYDSEIESLSDEEWATKYKVKASTMIAARTSYTVVGEDQKPWSFDKYVENGIKLETSNPLHASPLEHCAKAMSEFELAPISLEVLPREKQGWSGNFRGFIQYRKMLPNENIV